MATIDPFNRCDVYHVKGVVKDCLKFISDKVELLIYAASTKEAPAGLMDWDLPKAVNLLQTLAGYLRSKLNFVAHLDHDLDDPARAARLSEVFQFPLQDGDEAELLDLAAWRSPSVSTLLTALEIGM